MFGQEKGRGPQPGGKLSGPVHEEGCRADSALGLHDVSWRSRELLSEVVLSLTRMGRVLPGLI